MVKKSIIFLMSILLLGCAYELRLRYPSPVPSTNLYPLYNVVVYIADTEEEFQDLVEEEFGERDPDCAGFTAEGRIDNNGDEESFTIIVLRRKDDGSINLDWLGHELFYHYMEKEKGHK